MCVGAHTRDAIIAWNIKTMVLPMYNANVGIHFVSGAGMKATGHATAKWQKNGRLRIQRRARILHGSWLTRSNVQSAGNPSKRTKGATIWLAECVRTSSAGYASVNGQNMGKKLEATTIATSMKNLRTKEMNHWTKMNKSVKKRRVS